MKKGLRKRMTLLLAVALVITLFSGMTIFADDNDNASLSVEPQTANPGETVELPVSISDNPGVIGFDLKISYPETLIFRGVNKGSVIETAEKDAKLQSLDILYNTPEDADGYTLIGYAGEDNAKEDGELFTLMFEVAEDAQAGEAEVTIAPGTATESDGGIYTVNALNNNVVSIPINKEEAYASAAVTIKATETVDKTQLQTLINEATKVWTDTKVSENNGTDVDTEEYWVTKEKQDALYDEIQKALQITGNDDATQEETDAEIIALQSVLDSYKEARKQGIKLDKETLQAAVKAAQEDLDNTKVSEDGSDIYTSENWVTEEVSSDLRDAIDEASGILMQEEPSYEDLSEAYNALLQAQKEFEDAKKTGGKALNKEALKNVIDTAGEDFENTVISEDGEAVSKADVWVDQKTADAFEEAIRKAQEVYENADATDEEIAEVIGALQTAQKAFDDAKKAGTMVEKADTTQLANAIIEALTDAMSVNVSVDGTDVEAGKDWVKQEDRDALMEAVNIAKEVLADPGADQASIDAQVNALRTAIETFDAAKKQGTEHTHVWSDWTVTKAASVGEEGEKTRTCETCGETETETIPKLAGGNLFRIAGSTRYNTGIGIVNAIMAANGGQTFDSVIVTTGTNYADALAGSYLAKKKNAPILIIDPKNTSQMKEVTDYIKENMKSDGTVYILGGTAAVPGNIENNLKGYQVDRLAGDTRYDTNLEILKAAGVGSEEILVCTGVNFADSLSASATGLPILLVGNSLSSTQKAWLKSLSGNDYTIIGGTSAVSAAVEKEVKSYAKKMQRISGADRYETSILVAEEYFAHANEAVLAVGTNFPDGLCGGPLALIEECPLLLASETSWQRAESYCKKTGVHGGYVLGGDGLISDKVAKKILQIQ